MSEPQRSPFWQAVGFAWQLGYTIAIPLVLLTLGGRLLDKRLGTHPWFLIGGVLFSIIISTVGLVIRASRLMQTITKNSSDSSSRDDGNLPRS